MALFLYWFLIPLSQFFFFLYFPTIIFFKERQLQFTEVRVCRLLLYFLDRPELGNLILEETLSMLLMFSAEQDDQLKSAFDVIFLYYELVGRLIINFKFKIFLNLRKCSIMKLKNQVFIIFILWQSGNDASFFWNKPQSFQIEVKQRYLPKIILNQIKWANLLFFLWYIRFLEPTSFSFALFSSVAMLLILLLSEYLGKTTEWICESIKLVVEFFGYWFHLEFFIISSWNVRLIKI